MPDLKSNEPGDTGKPSLYLKGFNLSRTKVKFDVTEPAQAVTNLPAVFEQSSPLVLLVNAFGRLWAIRQQHGVALRPHPTWANGDKPYGNISSVKLPQMLYRFYYVENDDGRHLIILATHRGNYAFCYRIENGQFCIDYVLPDMKSRHKFMGQRGNVDADRNFAYAALDELLLRITEPPAFKGVF